MGQRALWQGRASVLLFSGTYVMATIMLVSIYKLEHIIYPGTYHPGVTAFFFDYLLVTPLEAWPFDNPRFVAIFLLQACTGVVFVQVAYRLLQTILSFYSVSSDRLVIRHFHYYGLVTHDIACSRIVDMVLVRPLPSALLGVAHIRLYTNDPLAPVIELRGLLGAKRVFKLLSAHCHACREQKNDTTYMPLPPLAHFVR